MPDQLPPNQTEFMITVSFFTKEEENKVQKLGFMRVSPLNDDQIVDSSSLWEPDILWVIKPD